MDPPILMRIVGRKAPHSAHRRCVSSQLDKTQSLNDGRCIRLRSIAPKHRFDANQKNYSHETAAPVGLCVHAQRVLCRRPSKAVLRRLASVSPSASVELTHAATILQRTLTLSERRCRHLLNAGQVHPVAPCRGGCQVRPHRSCLHPRFRHGHRAAEGHLNSQTSDRDAQETGSHNRQGHVSLANDSSLQERWAR